MTQILNTVLGTLPVMAAGAVCTTCLVSTVSAQERGSANASGRALHDGKARTVEGGIAGAGYTDDFETGYVPGPIAGQSNGVDGPWAGAGIISAIDPVQGLLSAQLPSTGSAVTAFDMNSGPFAGGTQFGTLAADVRIDGTGTTYDFVPRDLAGATQFFNTRIRFNTNGNIEVAQVNAAMTEFEFIDSGLNWLPGVQRRIAVEVVDINGMLNFYVDGNLVFTGEDTQFVLTGASNGIGDYLTWTDHVNAGDTYTIDRFSEFPVVCFPDDCPDSDSDGEVEVDDLTAVLLDWVTCCDFGGDFDCDGDADVDDLTAVILQWGFCPLVNDNCADALIASDGSTGFNNIGATTDGPVGCANLEADVWFNYVASCEGTVTIDSCGSSLDTVLAVYAGHDCPPGALLACNNDSCGVQSSVSLPVLPGDMLKIRVGGLAGATGGGTLNIDCVTAPVPANDDCANAEPLAIGATVSGRTTLATADPNATDCGTSVDSPGLWYSLIGDGNTLTASLCGPGTDYNSKIHVYCNDTGDACLEPVCVGGDDDGCGGVGVQSIVTWCSTSGQQYLLLVEGSNGSVGQFQLDLTTDGLPCSPPADCTFVPPVIPTNDLCQNALPILDGDTVYDSTNAATDGLPHAACMYDGQTYEDIWYTYTATCTGLLQVFTCNQATYDTDLVAYNNAGPAPCPPTDNELLGCNDEGTAPDGMPCGSFSSFLEIPVTVGDPILIRVGGWMAGDEGPATLTINCIEASNDNCIFAEPIEIGGTASDDTCSANTELEYVDCGGGPQDTGGRWFSVIGDGTRLRASLCASTSMVDTRMTVYCGPCAVLSEDNCVGEPIDSCFPNEEIEWDSVPGMEYLVLVHGNGECGAFQLDVTTIGASGGHPPCLPEPGCLLCGNTESEACGDDMNGGCSSGLIFEPVVSGQTICGTVWADGGIRDTDWYMLTVGASGTVTVDFRAELSVASFIITGTVCTDLEIVANGHSDGCLEASYSAMDLTPDSEVFIWFGVGTADGGGIFDGFPCEDIDGTTQNQYQAMVTSN